MANVLPRDKQLSVLHLLVEGNSIRSIERLTGVNRNTTLRLLLRVGGWCRTFLDRHHRRLELRHIQADGIWTFCRKKQAHLSDAERDDPALGDQYLFVAFDTDSKLVVTYTLGKRNGETTAAFINDLAARLIVPESPNAPWSAKPQLSTDGWGAYPDAILNAFGGMVQYGTIVKNYVNEEVGRYQPPEITHCDRRQVQGVQNLRTICTSHVERNNLTIRTFMRRFTRLSLGFSKSLPHLAAAVALHVCFYNYGRRHITLRCTPAMRAGLAYSRWSIEDLYDITRASAN